jgi:hypothetical protein
VSDAARPLLAADATAAVVLGASDWRAAGLGEAASFRRSAKGVVAWLYDRGGLGLAPDLVLDLFDSPESAGEQLARIRDTLDSWLRDRRERGTPVADVLVFYVGHGHSDEKGTLSLLVRDSRRNLEAETGIKAPDLARALRLGAPQQRRLVVLDCCFSEAAVRDFVGMSGALSQAVATGAGKALAEESPGRGTLLLCSSPAGEASIGAPGAERTLFTGAVLDVLREGVPGAGAALSFAELREAAFDRMIVGFGAEAPRPVLHQPDQRQGDLTRLGAFPNRAASGVAPPPRAARPEPAPEPPRAERPAEAAARPVAPAPEGAEAFAQVFRDFLPRRDRPASSAAQPGVGEPARGPAAAPSEPQPASRWAWLWWRPKTWRGWAASIVAMLLMMSLVSVWLEGSSTLPRQSWEIAADGMAREQRGDLAGAAELYLAAAQQSDPTAMARLGYFYENGLGGLPRSPGLAIQYYQRAAQRGAVAAQQRLMQLGQRW